VDIDEAAGRTPEPECVSLATIAREWARIGCIGFGGPPTHIELLRELCVQRQGWLDAREFEDAIAVCNLLSGPASTELAIFCAWRLRRRRGALIGGRARPDHPGSGRPDGRGRRLRRRRASRRPDGIPDHVHPVLRVHPVRAIPLARSLSHPWQYAITAVALILLLLLRRGVVTTLLGAGAAGVIIALVAGLS
jgi:hypothetical protein